MYSLSMIQGADDKATELLQDESSDADTFSSVHTGQDESTNQGSSTATSVKASHKSSTTSAKITRHSFSAATSTNEYK